MNLAAADMFPQQKYDVFLSFSGVDTRQTFTSHLYDALQRKKILTFIDDKLERGNGIEPSLVEAIKQSKLSVIIFSKNYAFSRWCLDELLHILDCKERNEQIVIPVFHDIDPSHVRKQLGSYVDAFNYLCGRFEDNTVSMWRTALTTAANLSGFDSNNIRPESKLVDEIVNEILRKLNRRHSSVDLEGYVGIKPHIQQIEALLCMHKQDICFRIIGIWGMGGIGKTTIANAVFHRLSSKFHACSFLESVTKESEKRGLDLLRNDLLCELLDEKGVSIGTPSIGPLVIKQRLSRTRVLIVLDDVSDSRQLDFLLGDPVHQFGTGSRVIITTRNKCILKDLVDDDHVYRMMKLDSPYDLKLFEMKAFKENSSREAYSDLSKEVVDYAKGIPLALKVLGSTFRHCNSREEWGDELKKLRKFPNKEIHDVLRLSYNRLEENEKGIFLDVACYLKGENICDAKRILEIHGFCASRGVSLLMDMCLVSISKDNRLEMHDLVQEMGRLIVREQCIEEPGNRSRLWNEGAYRVLKNNTGTAKVEALFLDKSSIPELQLIRAAFSNMHNLKLLKIRAPKKVHVEYSWSDMDTEEQQLISFRLLHVAKRLLSFLKLQEPHNFFRGYIGMNSSVSLVDLLPEGLESFPEELGYLYWDEYPLKSLPSKFSPINLVELHMPGSSVERLWNKGQNLENLKRIDLSYCEHLTEFPDLSRCLNIEKIDLVECGSLNELPSYFKTLEKLTHLNLGWCSHLKTLPEIPCNVEFLRLSGTAIQDIPTSIWSHEKLDILGLSRCMNLKNLTITAWKLNLYGGEQNRRGPQEVHLLDCKHLEALPDCIYSIKRLERLNLTGCEKLKKLPPFSVGSCSLTFINLSDCINLLEVPDGLIGLSSLQEMHLRGTMIESLPASIKHACRLRKLDLKNCKKLQSIPELPLLLRDLDADNCTSLKTVARSALEPQRCDHQDVGALNYCPVEEKLMFSNCFELDESSRSNIMSDVELRLRRLSSLYDGADSNIQNLIVISAGNVIPDWFSYQAEGCQIYVKFPPHWFDTANFLGFTVSVVFGLHNFDDDDGFSLTCKCSFKTCHGEGYEYSYKLPWVQCTMPESVHSDQVLVLFNKDTFWLEGNKRGSTPIPLNEVTEASFHFHQEATPYENLDKLKVKKCGIQMLYSQTEILEFEV